MKKTDDKNTVFNDKRIRHSALVTIISDAVLLVIFVVCLLLYAYSNNERNYNQNLENVLDIAVSNSRLTETALETMGADVRHAYNYCNGKTEQEILTYLAEINNKDEEYQLLRRDNKLSTSFYDVYNGYSTRLKDDAFQHVEYKNSTLTDSIVAKTNILNGEIFYTQNFNNQTDALRYFAIFCGISVQENGKQVQYYLVKPQKESTIFSQTQKSAQYTDMSIAICYKDGKYLANDGSFRGENFYDYLYKYNGLTIDEKNNIRNRVQLDKKETGVLRYQDYKRRDSVFAYATCGKDGDWIVVVTVPISEFAAEELVSTFPLIVIIFLTVLLLFNIYRLLMLVQVLRKSVVRERIANASKSSFLSRMSHEIRTPLNAVIGYNTIAREELSVKKNEVERKQVEMKVMDCLTKSDMASKHLLTVINDVLDMSAIDNGKINIANEQFDFRGLITSLTTVFYSQARTKGVLFEVVFHSLTEEWFIGDQMRVNQVLTNLLSNAVKFTPDGGRVTLTITQPDAKDDASHIRFVIRDTGIGMTQEYLHRIWTPFEQADSSISRRFGGSGLGLSITKNLVDLMGGSITVESELGSGTTFCLDLTFGRMEQPKRTENYRFDTVNALIVDDDPGTCDYVRLLFNRCGARCAAVTSGEDALKAVSLAIEQGKPYTACLVDWHMPGMDGIETVKGIRKTVGDQIPIIILTAYDFSELAEKATEIGMSRFIEKPLFQSSLFNLLADICGTKSDDKPRETEKIDFQGAHVILAEDNAMNMEIASTILASVGIQVSSAWNGREAYQMFDASDPGSYAVILMDVHMPDMNGYEATKAIRASSHPDAKTIPIIAMTADAFAENIAESYAAGMNGHISKPIDTKLLFDMLQQYIQ